METHPPHSQSAPALREAKPIVTVRSVVYWAILAIALMAAQVLVIHGALSVFTALLVLVLAAVAVRSWHFLHERLSAAQSADTLPH